MSNDADEMQGFVDAVAAESRTITELLAGADLEQPVPSCPDWNLRELILHLGEVQRFWAGNVEAADPSSHRQADHAVPANGQDLADWFTAGSGVLVQALSNAEFATPCWTWWDTPKTAGAVARHQVQEVAVRRWDAQSCMGSSEPIDAEVADDGVAEFLSIMLGPRDAELRQSVELIAVDTGSSWTLGPTTTQPHVSVRASASDMVLLLYRRLPLSTAEITGDERAARMLFDLAGTE